MAEVRTSTVALIIPILVALSRVFPVELPRFLKIFRRPPKRTGVLFRPIALRRLGAIMGQRSPRHSRIDVMRDYIDVCEEAARAGGAVLLDKVGHVAVREKGPADLVTEADLASQEAIRRIILEAFPDHVVLGEEDDPETPARHEPPAFRWLVDPLDGTTNYVHRVPHYSVSIALEGAGELLAAAVYDPVLGEMFTATVGGGAFLNGRRLHTSTVQDMSGSLAAAGFPPNVQENSPDLRVFVEAVTRCQAIRRTGSAALNLCYLAAGRFDLVWSLSTKVWDVAAGVLLIREAGGVVSSLNGGDLVVDDGRLLAAANRPLLDELRCLVALAGL